MLKKIKAGDLIIIKSIDRLGRNYSEILPQWQFITNEIHADILFSDMNLLDTRTSSDNLTGNGTAILRRRRELGYTQAYLSEFTGMSVSFISDLEHGKPTAEIEKAFHLANLLGLDCELKSRG